MLSEFLELSKFAGMRKDLVQAGGGNCSVKLNSEEMLIKASGFQLADLAKGKGYVKIKYKSIQNPFEIQDKYESLALENIKEEGTPKPSIESYLHALTKRFTLHTHPTLVNVLTTRKEGLEILKKLFPEATVVEYEKPGVRLARLLKVQLELSRGLRGPQIIFLKNHGLVISSDNYLEVIDQTSQILSIVANYLKVDIRKYTQQTFLYENLKKLNLISSDQILYLCSDFEKLRYLGANWDLNLCPDCIVYCGRKIFEYNRTISENNIEKFITSYGYPTVIKFGDNFYIIARNIKKAKEIEEVLFMTSEIAVLNKGIEVDYLTVKEQCNLLNWDAEKYRQNN